MTRGPPFLYTAPSRAGHLPARSCFISNAALRTLDYKGGLDAFIVKARDEKLSTAAQRIKRQVKAKLAEQTAA